MDKSAIPEALVSLISDLLADKYGVTAQEITPVYDAMYDRMTYMVTGQNSESADVLCQVGLEMKIYRSRGLDLTKKVSNGQ